VAELQQAAMAAALPSEVRGPLPQLVRDLGAALARQQTEHEALKKKLLQLQPAVINYDKKSTEQLTKAVLQATAGTSGAPDGGSRGIAADGAADPNDESPSAFGGGGRGGARLSGSVMLRTMGTRSVGEVTQLTVPQLKAELRARQLAVVGAKSTLLRRLLEALQRDKGDPGSVITPN
jgi:hypothetical protein